MRILRSLAVLAAMVMLTMVSAGSRAFADVLVIVDKSSQRMSVAVNGRTLYLWPVSTGRSGYGTPSGTFHPQWMARTYFSKKYYDSPMPHSIFFYHGFAIHGTESIHRLGGPASHGCVRLHPRNAATLFALVQESGMRRTRIIISESIALRRPERWSERESPTSRRIVSMTDRLMLAEQIERREALTKMAQMRAVDAVKRMSERDTARGAQAASGDDVAVAIGVQSDDKPVAAQAAARRMPGSPETPVVVLPIPRHRGASPLILSVPPRQATAERHVTHTAHHVAKKPAKLRKHRVGQKSGPHPRQAARGGKKKISAAPAAHARKLHTASASR
jgi:hypothetical protein